MRGTSRGLCLDNVVATLLLILLDFKQITELKKLQNKLQHITISLPSYIWSWILLTTRNTAYRLDLSLVMMMSTLADHIATVGAVALRAPSGQTHSS